MEKKTIAMGHFTWLIIWVLYIQVKSLDDAVHRIPVLKSDEEQIG